MGDEREARQRFLALANWLRWTTPLDQESACRSAERHIRAAVDDELIGDESVWDAVGECHDRLEAIANSSVDFQAREVANRAIDQVGRGRRLLEALELCVE